MAESVRKASKSFKYALPDKQTNPVLTSNIFSRMIFSYAVPLLCMGSKRTLESEDLYQILYQDSSEKLYAEFSREWDKEKDKIKAGKTPSFFKVLIRLYGYRYFLLGLVCLTEEVIRIIQPLFIAGLVAYFNSNSGTTRNWALFQASLLSLSVICLTIMHHPYFFLVQRLGMWLRIGTSQLIYHKLMKLSHKGISATSTGQIVNLLTSDVNRFDMVPLFLHFLWIGPLQLLAAILILYYKLGISSLAGFLLLILLTPLQTCMGRIFANLRVRMAVHTDNRVNLVKEVLGSMVLIKMFCWENLYQKLISELRRKEIAAILRTRVAQGFANAPFFACAKLIAFLTFLPYVMTGNSLTSEAVFIALAIYNPVRLSLTLFFPYAIQFFSEASVTIRRLEAFLLLDEQHEVHHLVADDDNEPGIVCENLIAGWINSDCVLKDISFSVAQSELVAIVGSVGAGKSSLISCLLKEMPIFSGSAHVHGSISYVAQEPWVFSATIRENILFNKEFNSMLYLQALKGTDLETDLSSFPNGDQTHVGERGVSLSGGQKARIALARAIYQDADVYLLDDPLSALDSKVGKHLFENILRGILKHKPILLITHQIHFLDRVDRILVLQEGKIVLQGNLNDIEDLGASIENLLVEDEIDSKGKERIVSQRNSFDETQASTSMPCIKNISVSVTHSTNQQGLSSKLLFSNSQVSLSSIETTLPEVIGAASQFSQAVSCMELIDITEHSQIPEGEPEETKLTGGVHLSIYWTYLSMGCGAFGVAVIVLLNIVAQGTYIFSDWWLAQWASKTEMGQKLDLQFYWSIFLGLTCLTFLFGLARALTTFIILTISARRLHNQILDNILRCPIVFFNTRPLGQILNRFSKDLGLMDEILPTTLYDFLMCLMMIIGILALVAVINPWVMLITFPLGIGFIYIRKFYLKSARDLKRLDGTMRSPVISHVNSSIVGLQTIRSCDQQHMFLDSFYDKFDRHTEVWYLILVTTRWLALLLDWLCALYITSVSFSCIWISDSLDAGLAGLTLTYSIGLMGLFQWGVRQSAEVASLMTSVERVLEYKSLETEAPFKLKVDLPLNWPNEGSIRAQNVSFRYKEDDPYVIKDLSFQIQSREKIGIVGRTGAGKSSLFAMLMRLAEHEGLVEIDGIDINSLGLHQLRGAVSVIPQDPTLFTGNIRLNLDPFLEYSDNAIWQALRDVEMFSAIANLPQQLETPVTEGGSNWSVGQRHLLCLARSLLRKNSILFIDEATANVDQRTDTLIQATIREKFKECTVLTIAHRLDTVIDCNRIMVMQTGRLAEFDSANNLLQLPQSLLSLLVHETGPEQGEKLRQSAKRSFSNS